MKIKTDWWQITMKTTFTPNIHSNSIYIYRLNKYKQTNNGAYFQEST